MSTKVVDERLVAEFTQVFDVSTTLKDSQDLIDDVLEHLMALWPGEEITVTFVVKLAKDGNKHETH